MIAAIALDCGADPNARDDAGRTPLFDAVLVDRIRWYEDKPYRPREGLAGELARKVIRALSTGGADLDSVDGNGYTALMYAAERGKSEVADYLVELGADTSP